MIWNYYDDDWTKKKTTRLNFFRSWAPRSLTLKLRHHTKICNYKMNCFFMFNYITEKIAVIVAEGWLL